MDTDEKEFQIETADFLENKIKQAGHSFAAFFRSKLNETKTGADLRRFEERFRFSSMRERLSSPNEPVVEKRLFPSAIQRSETIVPSYRSDNKGTILHGYAAVYNLKSEDYGGWREKIRPYAFDEILKKQPDTRLLFNHDDNMLLGRLSNRTLFLASDSHGLHFSGIMPEGDALTAMIFNRVQRRDITGCSFCFVLGKDSWEVARRPGDIDTRWLERIDRLIDVGPVTRPAYPDTTVHVVPDKRNNDVDDVDNEDDFKKFWNEVAGYIRLGTAKEKLRQHQYEVAGRTIERLKR